MAINAMHVAKTGLNAQQVRMQIISNNLANVNTNGFKRDRANFESLLYQIIRSSGAQTSVDTELTSGFSVGTGVNIVNSNKLHSQGSIVSTDNSLDLAIDGGGFFFKFYFQMDKLFTQEMVLFLGIMKVFLQPIVVL